MSSQVDMGISELAVTFSNQPRDGHILVGKICSETWLWVVRGTETISAIAIICGNEALQEGFVKLPENIQQRLPNKQEVHLAVRKNDCDAINTAIVDIKVVAASAAYIEAGFSKVKNVCNPDESGVKNQIIFQTRASQRKIKEFDYDVNDKLDCDDAGTWRTVFVKQIKYENGVKYLFCSFEGWDAKYDIWHPINSKKLAPFCYHTKGKWTGGKPKPAFVLAEQMEKFVLCRNSFTAIIESKSPFDSFSLAYLKNEGFPFIRSFLGGSTIDDALLDQAAAFLYLYVQVLAKSLQELEGEIPIEIIDAIITVFKEDIHFYKTYGNDSKLTDAKFADRKGNVSAFLINAINHFGVAGGFEAMMRRFKLFIAPTEGEKKSFISVIYLIQCLSFVQSYLKNNILMQIAQAVDFQQLIEVGLQIITDEELKKTNDELIMKVIKSIEALLRLTKNSRQTTQFIEVINLSFGLRLLNSSVLEKKINGMSKLTRVMKSIDAKNESKFFSLPSTDLLSMVPSVGTTGPETAGKAKEEVVPPAEFLTSSYMKDWILDHKLLQIILDRQQHPEIVRRSPSMLKFLARQGALTTEHINLLWSITTAGSHEDISRVVYGTFADIAQDLTKDQLNYLHAKLLLKPLQDYQDFDVTFVKNFTQNAVKATAVGAPGHWYGLDLFWQMSIDAKLSGEIRSLAGASLKDLLSQSLFASQIAVYERKAIAGLKLQGVFNPSFFSCLSLLQLILATDDAHVQQVEKEYGLVNLVLAGAELYRTTALAKKEEKRIAESPGVCYVSNLSHSLCILTVLAFLRHFLSQTFVIATENQLRDMWRVFVTGAVDASDRSAALSWFEEISYSVIKAPGKFVCLNSAGIRHIFDLLCQQHLDTNSALIPATRAWFQCFMKFFLLCNIRKGGGILDDNVEYLQVTDFKQLGASIQAIWPFIISQDVNVSTPASKFFVSLHIRLDPSYPLANKKEIFEHFINTCITKLGELKSPDQQSLVLGLLLQFLDRLQKGESVERPLFKVGEKSWAFFKSSNQPNSKKWGCTIVGLNPCAEGKMQTYDLLYDDGDIDHFAPESNLFNFDEKQTPRVRPVLAPSENANAYPREHLAKSSRYFNLFFDLLGVGGEVGSKAWTLLSSLPTNVALSESIRNLQSATHVDWKVHLPSTPLTKLYYIMQIVEKSAMVAPALAAEEKNFSAAQAWCRMFVHTGGFQRILDIFMNVDTKQMCSNTLCASCIGIILNLVTYFLMGTEDGNGIDGAVLLTTFDSAQFLDRLLRCLLDVVSNTTQQNLGILPESILASIRCCLRVNLSLSSSFFAFQGWNSVLQHGFLRYQDRSLRCVLGETIRQLKSVLPSSHEFFLPRLLNLLPEMKTTSPDNYCVELLEVVGTFLGTTSVGTLDINLPQIAENVTSLIQKHPFQDTDRAPDQVLSRLLDLAGKLVLQNSTIQTSLGSSLSELIVHCLFDLPTSTNAAASAPKCKSPAARAGAFRVLNALCSNHPGNTRLVAGLLEANHIIIHSNGKCRDRKLEWFFEPKPLAESEGRQGRHAGLVNLGCICYMNAANQQLFHIPKLRKNILAITPEFYDAKNISESVIYQYQYVMSYLQDGQSIAVNPAGFCRIWTDEAGEPINVGRQEDSQQYMGRLIDRFGDMLKPTPFKDTFLEVVGGSQQTQMIGKGECKHMWTREEPFTNILVEIKQKKTLLESLKAFVAGETMSGDNAIRCDCCNKKVDATRRTVISKLPSTLIIALKRFELNYQTFQSLKVNDRLEFPMDLDMKPYTVEALTSEAQLQTIGETKVMLNFIQELRAAAKKNQTSDSKAAPPVIEVKADDPALVEAMAALSLEPKAPAHPNEYYQYRLRGVVVHTGSANGGHYYSYIQERTSDGSEGNWFQFNDQSVTPFDPVQLPDATFGFNKVGYATNGYLLFYDRVKLPVDGVYTVITRAELPNQIFQEISEQNITYWRDRNVFDETYFEHLKCLINSSVSGDPDSAGLDQVDLATPASSRDALTRLALRFYFVTLIRSKSKTNFFVWKSQINELLSKSVTASAWFLNKLCTVEIDSRWWLVDGLTHPLDDIRRATADLIFTAFAVISPLEQVGYALVAQPLPSGSESLSNVRQDSRGYAVGLLSLLLKVHFPFFIRNPAVWDEYFYLLTRIVKLGAGEATFAQHYALLAKSLDVYLGPDSPCPELNPTALRGPLEVNFRPILDLISALKPDNSQVEGTLLTAKSLLPLLLQEAISFNSGRIVVQIVSLIISHAPIQSICTQIYDYMLARPHDRLRPVFRVITGVLNFSGTEQPLRVDAFLSMLVQFLTVSRMYWRVYDFVVDHVLRMIKNNQVVLQWFRDRGSCAREILAWYEANPIPTADSQSGMFLDRGDLKASMKYTATSKHCFYHIPITDKKNLLLRILEGAELDTDNAGDSDVERKERKFVVGDRVDAWDNNDWLPAEVINVYSDGSGDVKIHYIGYKDQYDERVHHASLKLLRPVGFYSNHNPPKKPRA
jgi:ubiquitin C-terminal hydrolase